MPDYEPGEGPSNPKASKEHAAKVKGKDHDDKRDKAAQADLDDPALTEPEGDE